MEEMDKIVKLYKKLSKTQSLAGGHIFNNVINTIWSQRNIETGKIVKYMRAHFVDDKFANVTGLHPIDISQELLSTFSVSEKYRAVLKDLPNNGKENRKQLLEIWTNNNLSHSVDLTALNVHGDVYTDVEFKSLAFSPDETKILYIAEKKLGTREPFYKRKSDKDDNSTNDNAAPATKGEEYAFRQDWGEQLTGKYSSVIAIYDLEQDNVSILEGIPADMCPGQMIWSPDGSSVVGVALETEPRKLGLIYCSNRAGVIFQLDLNGTYRILSEKGKSAKSPRFSPDGKYLIWLERESNGPHNGALRLMRLDRKELIGDSATVNATIVVDIIENKIPIANNKYFYGFYDNSFTMRCWASDNKRVILSTPQNYSIKIYIINIESGSIIEVESNENDSKMSSYVLLDVFQDRLLVSRKNYCLFDQCLTCVLPEEGNEQNIKWTEITEKVPINELKNITYEYLDLEQETKDEIRNFNAIYLGPKSGQSKQFPLVVWPHGGPHSAFVNAFGLNPSVLVSLGYAILFVNYRGSTGNGQASVDFLRGRVGDADVKDCVLATNKCCELYPWLNPERLALIGGSHGGFLIHHLSGQYPDMFKAVVSRNPVIDISSMIITSDIPDWCAVEAGSCYSQKGPIDNKLLIKMREVSPIQHAHKIKAATFLMLGTKDLRVPMSQGMELYYRLKTNNVPVKLNVYDDNHAISTVPNEMDDIINGVLWLNKYT